jgi:hypothetical protein
MWKVVVGSWVYGTYATHAAAVAAAWNVTTVIGKGAKVVKG